MKQQGVTFIDDLLDLDEPMQRGAFNKVATKHVVPRFCFECHNI